MKGVFIKWCRGDRYEKKGERKAAIANAHRTIRQHCRNQLHLLLREFDLNDWSITPGVWCETGEYDPTWDDHYDSFEHPRVRLGYFD